MKHPNNLLTKEANELRDLLKLKFGLELTEQEAQAESDKLLSLFHLLLTNSSVTGYNQDNDNSTRDLSRREVPKID